MAMSKPTDKYVEEMLECSVCLSTVQDPHTLQQCLHTYCKECIDQLIHKQNNHPPGVNCPVCRNFSGKDEIRSNFFIKDLVQHHRSSSKTESSLNCEQCLGEHGQAAWKCLDCRMWMCDSCKEGHLRVKLLQDHRFLPLNSAEQTDTLIDQIVFCTIHKNKPIELYCKPCAIPICMKCKVTTHEGHKSESIEETLERIVPEIQQNTSCIDQHLEQTAKSITEIDAKVEETRETFKRCHVDVNKAVEDRIKKIKDERSRLNQQLNKDEAKEIEKLKQVKEKLQQKQKEGEHLRRVVVTSLDKARHATLLTELVQGGLQKKMKSLMDGAQPSISLDLNLPKFNVKSSDPQGKGLFGQVVMVVISLIISKGSLLKNKQFYSGEFWTTSFKEYFSRPLKQILQISLPDQCTRVAVIGDHIWAPICYGNINIYNKNGEFTKTINITNPVSVKAAFNGDIFVACIDNSGLYVITDNANPVKICSGFFSDVCQFKNKIYALEYKQKQMIEFSYVHDETQIPSGKWKEGRKLQLSNYTGGHYLDTVIAINDKNITLCFYVGTWNQSFIYRYNEQGQQINKYGDPNGQGQSQMSRPLLCGIDSQSHILVADAGHKKYKILDPESGQWSDTGVTGQRPVYDAKTDNEGFLWLSQYTGSKRVLTKYQLT